MRLVVCQYKTYKIMVKLYINKLFCDAIAFRYGWRPPSDITLAVREAKQ